MDVRGWGQGKEYTQEGHFTSLGTKLASRSGVEAKVRAELWKEALLWEGLLSKNLGVACGFFGRLEEWGLVEDSARSGGRGWRGAGHGAHSGDRGEPLPSVLGIVVFTLCFRKVTLAAV